MATLKRLDPTYRMHELPPLAYNRVLYNNSTIYTGSKIERYIKGVGIYKHEGFIYGTGIDGMVWIIENNTNGVECVSIRDFMQGMTFYKVYPNLNPLLIAAILTRANERALLTYHSRENNCQTFVTYSLTGKCESVQVERTEIVVDILISFAEFYLMNGSVNPKVIESYTKIREAIKLKRAEPWQAQVEKYTQKFSQTSEAHNSKPRRKSTGERHSTKSEQEIILLNTNKTG